MPREICARNTRITLWPVLRPAGPKKGRAVDINVVTRLP